MYAKDKLFPDSAVELEPWRKALLEAADIIERGGLCKNTATSGTAHCTIAAIATACGRLAIDINHKHTAWAILQRQVGCGSIVDWSDAPERTAAEVIAALTAAARTP